MLALVILAIGIVIIVAILLMPKKTTTVALKENKPFIEFDVNSISKWLDNANEAYILAFQRRSVNEFSRFASHPLNLKTQQKILRTNDIILCTKKYRNTKWSAYRHMEDGAILIKKEMTFKTITLGKATVSMGDNITEYWKIRVNIPNTCIVEDILC